MPWEPKFPFENLVEYMDVLSCDEMFNRKEKTLRVLLSSYVRKMLDTLLMGSTRGLWPFSCGLSDQMTNLIDS